MKLSVRTGCICILFFMSASLSYADSQMYNYVFSGSEYLPSGWSVVTGFRHSFDENGSFIFHGGASAVYDIYGGKDKSDYAVSAVFEKPASEETDFAAVIFRYNGSSDFYYAGLKGKSFIAIYQKTKKEDILLSQEKLSSAYEDGTALRIVVNCRGETAKANIFSGSSNIGSVTAKGLKIESGTIGLFNRNSKTIWRQFVSSGDIQYKEDFNWKPSPKDWQPVTNAGNWYEHGGAYKYLSLNDSIKSAISIVETHGCADWRNYAVAADLGSNNPQGYFGVAARYVDDKNYYAVRIKGDNLDIIAVSGGVERNLANLSLGKPYIPKQMWRILFELDNDRLNVRVYDGAGIIAGQIETRDQSLKYGKAGVCGVSGAFWNSFSVSTVEPVKLDKKRILFLDDNYVSKSVNIKRSLHSAKKLPQPVVSPDKPWEKTSVYMGGMVRHNPDKGIFEMWYSGGGMCYATSKDGVNWDKPVMGLFEKNGVKDTNIVFARGPQSVFYDPLETDPAKRYKAFGARELNYMWGAYSGDGFNWHEYEQQPIMPFGSETGTAVRDTQTGKIMAFVRPCQSTPLVYGIRGRRILSVASSDDFVHWNEPREIIIPDDIDDQWVKDPQQRTEYYSMSGFRHGAHYVGIIQTFHLQKILDKETLGVNQSFYEGPIFSQLVHSLDGFVWRKFTDRSPVITNGPTEFDAGCIMFLATEPVIYKDEIWHYYTGINTTHGGTMPPKKISIARASWRIDGFASVTNVDSDGIIETVPFIFENDALKINADAANGEIIIELINPDGKAIDGFKSLPVNTDGTNITVKWQNGKSNPLNMPVCIRFNIKNADLYSFYSE